ncbi:MAG: hypothetical protein SNJ79_09045, partial [Sphingomonadaceae bacterium]
DGRSRTLRQDLCAVATVEMHAAMATAAKPPGKTLTPGAVERPPLAPSAPAPTPPPPPPDLPAKSLPEPGEREVPRSGSPQASGPGEPISARPPLAAPEPTPSPPSIPGREGPPVGPPAVAPPPATGAPPASPSPPGDPSPAEKAGPDGRTWCAVVEERLPPEECAFLSSVARGTGAFRAPDRMRKDEVTSVTLAISRTAGSDAPSRALAGAPGTERRFAPAVGRFLKAELLASAGLAVTPDPKTPELQDLYASDEAFWRWTVMAKERGRHDLTIRTRVMTRLPDGSFAPRGEPFTDSRTVEVVVEGAAAVRARAEEASGLLEAVQAPTESLTRLLVAVAAAIAALGGVWLAIRNFGRKRPDA